jgi:BirA family biotin operon repressor/biotin-[acetyl-CoA-carboxylase] ligase
LYNISANTIFTGKTLIYLPTCHSTNDYATNLINETTNAAEGTLVITPCQTAGKGQRGNSWESQPGENLTFSIIFHPSFLSIQDQFYLNIISALAVRNTIAHYTNEKVMVKWPNDIYLNNKKICGILIQNTIKKDKIGHSIIGIGLNVNQKNFAEPKATSLYLAEHKEFDHNAVLNTLLENLEGLYLQLRQNGLATLYQAYLSHLYRYNSPHMYQAGEDVFEGTITGLDSYGRLLILLPEGTTKAFAFKEVAFL